MNAIVIDAQMVVPLPAYRVAIAQWVSELKPPREWGYDPFKNFSDLIPSVTKARHNHLCEIVEIVAHGTPTFHGDIGEPTVASVATKLRPMLDLHPVPAVYLTGCNTGLRLDGYCIAEALAQALCGVTVYGAAGFIVSGSAATADAETDVTYDGET